MPRAGWEENREWKMKKEKGKRKGRGAGRKWMAWFHHSTIQLFNQLTKEKMKDKRLKMKGEKGGKQAQMNGAIQPFNYSTIQPINQGKDKR